MILIPSHSLESWIVDCDQVYVTKEDLELLILLPLLLECCYYSTMLLHLVYVMLETQGSVHVRQALCHLNCIPSSHY